MVVGDDLRTSTVRPRVTSVGATAARPRVTSTVAEEDGRTSAVPLQVTNCDGDLATGGRPHLHPTVPL